MDGTQDAPRERITEQVRDEAESASSTPPPMSRKTVRRLSWALAWGLPVIALIVGIALTATGAVEQWEPLGEGAYDVTLLAVWPAGLVLLAVGALGLAAAAIATAVVMTER
ncbi:hypothetical protein JOF42_000758 [Microbacterium phyllosphaerae]|uniref:Uncharacterized protein n=1 Tax=Microbacterium phyllosphaerae TaxID=124798 RepID=A0ABS4WM28_9MICO|nr:hypothetical protein [Microbacterium phyllosphaerae]MBP2377263.1 hypothetical protein [Microbacterium phyllosphaerae]